MIVLVKRLGGQKLLLKFRLKYTIHIYSIFRPEIQGPFLATKVLSPPSFSCGVDYVCARL